jgi:hypothetical protein
VVPLYNYEKGFCCTSVLINSDSDSIIFALATANHCVEKEKKKKICFSTLYLRDTLEILLNSDIPNIACFEIKLNDNYFTLDNDSIDLAVFVFRKGIDFFKPKWDINTTVPDTSDNIIKPLFLEEKHFSYKYTMAVDVFILAFPLSYGAEEYNNYKPAFISGRIAHDNLKNYKEGPVLLVNYASLSGMSGGPAFRTGHEGRFKGKKFSISPGGFPVYQTWKFIGIDVIAVINYPIYNKEFTFGDTTITIEKYICINSGLSEVISAKILRELLYKADVWERENE